MKRSVFLFLLILMIPLNCLCCFAATGEPVYEGAYTYYINESGEAVITSCYDITSTVIRLPASLGGYKISEVKGGAFSKCSSLSVLASDNPLFKSENGVLYKGDKLICYPPAKTDKAFDVPEWVLEILPCAFTGNTFIASVSMNSSVWFIPSECFAGCLSLKNVNCGNIIDIHDGAFAFCTSLDSISLPESLTAIGKAAFYGCSGLKQFELSDNVKSVGTMALGNCTSLEAVRIPEAINDVNTWLLDINPTIKTISVSENNKSFIVRDNILYSIEENGMKLVYCPPASGINELNVSDDVIIIGSKAFENHRTLEKLVVSDSVYEIEAHAFYNASALVDVKIGAGLHTIGDYAFFGCMGLGNIRILASVTDIGIGSFENCGNINLIVAKGSEAFVYAENSNVNYTVDETQPEVTPANWADRYISWAKRTGIIYGDMDCRVPLTREGCSWLIMNFYEGLNGAAPIPENPFWDTDLPPVLKAYNLGIISGVDQTHFEPTRPVTRQELCVCLVKLITLVNGSKPINDELPYFIDDASIADWSREYMSIAYSNNIITGFPDGTIRPDGYATVEEALAMLYNMSKLKNN